MKRLAIIGFIIYCVFFSIERLANYISTTTTPTTNDIYNEAYILILQNETEPFKKIKLQVQNQNTTYGSKNICLEEFSGEYEELSPISIMNNTDHKYTIEEIYFSLTTNTKRIRTFSIHFLKFWARLPNINCLIVFEENDFKNNKNITEFLLSEGIRCKVRTSNVTTYVKRYGDELFRLALNSQDKEDIDNKRKKIQWFATGDDDTIWFLNNLLRTLQQYNSSNPIYLGNISDNPRQLKIYGEFFAYGGGGVLLSRPLALRFAQHTEECRRFPNKEKSTGDMRIGKCVTEVLNHTLTKNNHFHQMDHFGRLIGYLEGGIDGLVTLHHMFTWWKPFTAGYNDNINETMHFIELAYQTFDKGFLKRYVRINHKTNRTLLLTLGYSFSLFNRILSYTELNQIEITGRYGKMVARETRPKEENKITWFFRDVKSEIVNGSLIYRITHENKPMYNQTLNIEITPVN